MSTGTPTPDDSTDSTDTVTIGTSARGRSPDVFHPRPEKCTHLPDRTREIDRAKAEGWGLRACGFCAAGGGAAGDGSSNRDYDQLVADLQQEMGIETDE